MVNMQNLQSQMSDSIIASGQFTGKKTDSSRDSISSFLNILNSTLRNSESRSSDSLQKKSDNIMPDKNPESMKFEEKTVDAKATEGENGTVSLNEEKNGSENPDESVAASTCAEMLVMIAAADGSRVMNVDISNEEVSVKAVEIGGKSENSSSGTVELNVAAVQPSEEMHTEAVVNPFDRHPEISVKASEEPVKSNARYAEPQVKVQVSSEASTSSVKEPNVGEVKLSTHETKSSENSKLRVEHEKIDISSIKSDEESVVNSKKIENDAIPTQVKYSENTTDEPVIIKVGDGGKISQQLTANVADAVVTKLSDNIKEFTISINPENLGRIDIKISLSDGKVHVLMKASHEATHRTLVGNENAIRQIIEQNTGQETNLTFQRSADPNSHMRDNSEGGNGQSKENRGEHQNNGAGDNDVSSFIQQLRLGLVEGGSV